MKASLLWSHGLLGPQVLALPIMHVISLWTQCPWLRTVSLETFTFMVTSDSFIFVSNSFNISLLKYKARQKKKMCSNCPCIRPHNNLYATIGHVLCSLPRFRGTTGHIPTSFFLTRTWVVISDSTNNPSVGLKGHILKYRACDNNCIKLHKNLHLSSKRKFWMHRSVLLACILWADCWIQRPWLRETLK